MQMTKYTPKDAILIEIPNLIEAEFNDYVRLLEASEKVVFRLNLSKTKSLPTGIENEQ